MAAAAQLALPFEQQEHFLYHDTARSGFVSLWLREPGGKAMQYPFRLRNMATELAAHSGKVDRWISQGEFHKPNRRVVNLSRMPVVFADLDTYKSSRLGSLSPEALVDCLLRACDDRQIPAPSIIVHSGRGLQVKWLLTEPVPQAALPRWSAVQRQLNQALTDFGSDPFAMDASRVLRLEGSVNSRSGQVVRVLHLSRTPALGGELLANGVVGYDFDVFADTVLPIRRQDLAQMRASRDAERAKEAVEKAAREARRANLVVIPGGRAQESKARNLRPMVPSELAWDRLADLRTLARIRGHQDGLPPGHRNEFLFLGACFLAQACLVNNLRSEIEELATEFAPTWSPAELASCVSAAFSRAEAAARGDKVEFNGVKCDPRYVFKNSTLVDRLGITSPEATQLKTILPADEARRRDAARQARNRREAGAMTRKDYLAQADEKRQRVRALAETGLSNTAIARELGIPRTTVIRILKG